MSCSCTDHSHLLSLRSFLKAYQPLVIWFCSKWRTPPEKEILQWLCWWPKTWTRQHREETFDHSPIRYGKTNNLQQKPNSFSRWWFQVFFMFTPIWGNDPIWLKFFKWVETTQLVSDCTGFLTFFCCQDLHFCQRPSVSRWQIGVLWLLMFRTLKPFEHLCPM